MGLWLVVHAWAVVFAAMALVVGWPARWAFLLAFVVISNQRLHLAILMHDAAHRLLFADPGARGREAVAGGPSSNCEAIETVERSGLVTLG
jgi:hypothetical protein